MHVVMWRGEIVVGRELGRCVVDSCTVGEILAEYRVRWIGDVIHLKACGDGSAKRM